MSSSPLVFALKAQQQQGEETDLDQSTQRRASQQQTPDAEEVAADAGERRSASTGKNGTEQLPLFVVHITEVKERKKLG